MVRAGERWGVLTTGMVGSNILKGMGLVFAGAHVTKDIDVFGGAVYRSQTNYRDGDGKEWPNTGSNVASGIGKLTIRPADGHEVKFTGLTYETTYLNGQPTATLPNTNSIYDTRVQNDIAAARWRYNRPDDRLFDFDANVYWTRTVTDQQRCWHQQRSPAPSAQAQVRHRHQRLRHQQHVTDGLGSDPPRAHLRWRLVPGSGQRHRPDRRR